MASEEAAWAIQKRLQDEWRGRPDLYERSGSQLPDHVHNRVTRIVLDALQAAGFHLHRDVTESPIEEVEGTRTEVLLRLRHKQDGPWCGWCRAPYPCDVVQLLDGSYGFHLHRGECVPEPDNHHNAGVCPYCTHNGEFELHRVGECLPKDQLRQVGWRTESGIVHNVEHEKTCLVLGGPFCHPLYLIDQDTGEANG